MRNTMHKTGITTFGKAGATSLGLDTAGPSAENPLFTQTAGPFVQGNGTTTHWKSSYKGGIEESLNQPQLKA
jgi:hypothetical protein